MQSDRELMQQALEALEYPGPSWPDARQSIAAALRERLAQPEQDWDWRHPKAQALIGAKARLQIKLRLVEQLLEDPNLETTASDMEYWEPLHDKLQERLAQPEQEPCREWVGLTEEEKRQLFEREDYQGWLDYINAIEAKLKEKNA